MSVRTRHEIKAELHINKSKNSPLLSWGMAIVAAILSVKEHSICMEIFLVTITFMSNKENKIRKKANYESNGGHIISQCHHKPGSCSS